MRIHLWFTRTTAQGGSLRRAAIMNPQKCKQEHEISASIEKWEERYRVLKEEDRELELPDSWKITALQSMLCGEILKSVEYREEQFNMYEELRATVKKWAINKNVEKERTNKGDPMDCSEVDKNQEAGHHYPQQEEG